MDVVSVAAHDGGVAAGLAGHGLVALRGQLGAEADAGLGGAAVPRRAERADGADGAEGAVLLQELVAVCTGVGLGFALVAGCDLTEQVPVFLILME